MRFLYQLLILVLFVLIKIGDAVLFGLNSLFLLVKKLILMPLPLLASIERNLAMLFRFILTLPLHLVRFILRLILNTNTTLKIASHTISALFRSIRLPKRKKKLRPIVAYQPRRKSYTLSPFSFAAKLKYFGIGAFFSFLFLFIPLLFFIFLQDVPSPRELTLREIPQTTKIYDRNNTLLYQIYATQNRTIIPLNDVPTHLQRATIAIEDKDFYNHPGFDITAIIRSAIGNIQGKDLQGGSTITQQLVKSALLTPETTISRKVKEIIIAFWTERLYTKRQILELYFNQVPYGGTAWGVQAASEVYFGKSVRDLTLSESAFLAGIPQAPTTYSPYGSNPLLWKKRQKEVLNRMVTLQYITQKEADEAYSQPLEFEPPRTPIKAPHFVMYVKELLVRKYGLPAVERGGLNVITSLDIKTQDMAQQIVTEEVNTDAYLNLTNGAALVTNPENGDILAMVGSKDFSDSKSGNVNLTTARRQPGSSIKIVTYTAALLRGLTAASIIDDSPVVYASAGSPSYAPVNYDGRFHGRVPLRLAFANSFNIPAVKTLNQVGIPAMVSLAQKLGVKSWGDPDRYGLSLTLGSAEVPMVELATIYGVFANGGLRADVNPLLKVTDSKGYILEEKNDLSGKRVLDEGIAFIISHILADNHARSWAFGANSILNIPGKTVSVKTGTTDNKRDNWTIGYTPSYLVAVWVGNNDNSPMSQSLASGVTGAAPIWNKIMVNLLNGKPNEPLRVPAEVVQKPCLGKMEYFIRGTENSVNCASLPPSPSVSPARPR